MNIENSRNLSECDLKNKSRKYFVWCFFASTFIDLFGLCDFMIHRFSDIVSSIFAISMPLTCSYFSHLYFTLTFYLMEVAILLMHIFFVVFCHKFSILFLSYIDICIQNGVVYTNRNALIP